MEITFGRRLLWIFVMVVSIAVVTRCQATGIASTAAEDSATTMMSVETVFQSTSAVTMETVRTETESPDTTATLGAVMTTSGALPATRDATSGTLLVLVATAILMMHRIQLYELL